ncbi:hypothetical protein [Sutterella sp.]|uniref:hypothetical protein n=1 Tax=Sutterella sp. TaxID=1981025 RepID=UPI0026E01B04|nr:hypothetical protein [Sutterella sp.]MDO5532760.1 hypothetical protein [Sutterella sp.]
MKRMRMGKIVRTLGAAAAAAALLAGCSSPKFEVGVRLSEDLRDLYGYLPSIEVDLAGVNPEEAERVNNYSVDRWFEPGNPMRASLIHKTLRFSEDAASPKNVPKDDPLWGELEERGSTLMAVLVNLPPVAAEGDGDPRRIMVPIRSEHWYEREGGSLWFEIAPGGVVRLGKPASKPKSSVKTVEAPPDEPETIETNIHFASDETAQGAAAGEAAQAGGSAAAEPAAAASAPAGEPAAAEAPADGAEGE